MLNQRESIDKLDARLNELDREISELEKMADRAVAEVKADYQQQIKNLFVKKEELQNKVSGIREASGNAWEDMKAGAGLSWEVFNDSVKPVNQKKAKQKLRSRHEPKDNKMNKQL
jgi:phage host-nuclease inhibitor protein Gam